MYSCIHIARIYVCYTAASINNLTTLWSLFNTCIRLIWEVFFFNFVPRVYYLRNNFFVALIIQNILCFTPPPPPPTRCCTNIIFCTCSSCTGHRRATTAAIHTPGAIHHIIASARLKFHYVLNRFLVYIPHSLSLYIYIYYIRVPILYIGI